MRIPLGPIHIGFPVLEFECTVTHCTPRKATVFEEMICKLVAKLSHHSAYGSMSLRQLFEEILCVPDAQELASPSLDQLVGLGILSNPNKYGFALREIFLRDLSLTRQGVDFLNSGMLPARPTDVKERLCYDETRNVFLNSSEQEKLKKKDGFYALPSLLQDGVPADIIRRDFGSTRPEWMTAHTLITRIIPGAPEVLYRIAVAAVQITEQGKLHWGLKNPEDERGLESGHGQELFDKWIAPKYQLDGLAAQALPMVAAAKILPRVGEILPIGRLLESRSASRPAVEFVALPRELARVPEALPGHLIVCLDGPKALTRIVFSEDRTGAVIHSNESMVEPDAWVVGTGPIMTGGGQLLIDEGGVRGFLPCAWHYTSELARNSYELLIARLDASLASSEDLDVQSLRCLYLGPQKVWQDLVARVKANPEGLKAKQIRLENTAKKLFGARADAAAFSNILRILIEELEQHPPDDAETVREALEVSTALPEGPVRKRFRTRLAELIQPPQDLAGLDALWSVCSQADDAESLIGNPRIYHAGIIEKLLNGFPTRPVESFLNRSSFDAALANLKQCELKILAALQVPSLEELEPNYSAAPAARDTHQLQKLLKEWEQRYADLFRTRFAKPFAERGSTPIHRMNDRLCQWAKQWRAPRGATNESGARIFVLDTNVFLADPEILKRFAPSDQIKVSKTVLAELDHFKDDQKLGVSARAAIKALSHCRDRLNIAFEAARSELLPSDYNGAEPDHRILSVALHFKAARPVLVTSDQNLQLKAGAEGLQTLSLQAFLKSEPRTPSKS
ncbi:MAG: hypothetical protein HY735_27830 [Verrucomicrobia bacterium]|nr:hypothetical protein [Verrucomicrobiota bacterium]